MNCTWLLISLTISQNLPTFASSSGASTSSKIQKGAGLSVKRENKIATAVSAFSPPDKRFMEEIISKYAESTHLHIEIKGRTLNLAQKTCTLIRSLEATDMVTITSFWKDSLVETKNFAPEMKTGWLVPMGPGSKWDNEIVEISKKYKFDQICPRAESVSYTHLTLPTNREV